MRFDIWIAGGGTVPTPSISVANNFVAYGYYGIVYDSENGKASDNQVRNLPVGLMAVTYFNFNTIVHNVDNDYSHVGVNTQVLQPNPPYTASIVNGN